MRIPTALKRMFFQTFLVQALKTPVFIQVVIFLYFTDTKHNTQTCYELFHLLEGCAYVTASSSLYLILTLYSNSYGFVSAQTNR